MAQLSANKVRRGLQGIQLDIFTEKILLAIGIEKAKYMKANNTYSEMRSTSTAKVDETIQDLISIPNLDVPTMIKCLEGVSVNIQSFVLDRFLYAYEHMSKLGVEMFEVEANTSDFLRQVLIDLWHDRNPQGLWK